MQLKANMGNSWRWRAFRIPSRADVGLHHLLEYGQFDDRGGDLQEE
jgi:hypothetical protein